MVRARLSGSGKSKGDLSPPPFLPAEVRRKHLVQKPKTPPRKATLVRTKQPRGSGPDDRGLPILKSGLPKTESGIFQDNMAIRFNFLKINEQAKSESMTQTNSEVRFRLPQLRKDTSIATSAATSKCRFSGPNLTGNNSIAFPVISNGFNQIESLPEQPNLMVAGKNKSSNERRNSRLSCKSQEMNLAQRQLIVLPKLGKNYSLTSDRSLWEADLCNSRHDSMKRKGKLLEIEEVDNEADLKKGK